MSAERLDGLRRQMSKEKAKRSGRWAAGCVEAGSLRGYGRELRSKSAGDVAKRRFDQKPPSHWRPRDVGDWLEALGLERYRASFEAHHVTGSALLGLGLDDLDGLSVEAMVDRKRLLKAVASLGQGQTRPDLEPVLVPLDNANEQTMWTNPAGVLDEDAEHDAFRRAVEDWRKGSSDTATGSARRKTGQEVADALAERVDGIYRAEAEALARRKAEARDLLQQAMAALDDADEEGETMLESTAQIALVESRLGYDPAACPAELAYTVVEA